MRKKNKIQARIKWREKVLTKGELEMEREVQLLERASTSLAIVGKHR